MKREIVLLFEDYKNLILYMYKVHVHVQFSYSLDVEKINKRVLQLQIKT